LRWYTRDTRPSRSSPHALIARASIDEYDPPKCSMKPAIRERAFAPLSGFFACVRA